MGLELDDEDLIRIVNLHGNNGKINRRQVRTAIREICMRIKFRQALVDGSENPNTLRLQQLKVLCEEPWERQVGFNHLTNATNVDAVLTGQAFKYSAAGFSNQRGRMIRTDLAGVVASDKFEFANRTDLVRHLGRAGLVYQRYGDLTVQSVKWDGKTALERKAIEDLGFLFLTYKPRSAISLLSLSLAVFRELLLCVGVQHVLPTARALTGECDGTRCWWFELYELMRKLIIVGTLAFVWDGTPSQVTCVCGAA